jgi:hypothetical protein
MVRARAAAAIEARLGLRAQIHDVSVGSGEVELAGIDLFSASGAKGVNVHVDRVHVGASLIGAAFRGAAAVRGVEAEGVRASADLSSKGFTELMAKLRAPKASSAGAASSAESRSMRATGVSLRVTRGAMPVLELENAKLELGANEASLDLPSVKLQAGERGAATLQGVKARATHAAEWQLTQLTIASASLSAKPKPLKSQDPAIPPVDPPTPAKADDPSVPPSAAAIMARLAPGADLVLQRASVNAVAADGSVQVLNDVQGRITVTGENQLHVTGHGVAEHGGRLDADLTVRPIDLRADGTIVLKAMPLTLLVPFLPNLPWYEPELAHIDAELSVKTESLERVALAGRAVLDKGAIFSPRIAADPVRDIDVQLDGQGYWYPLRRRLEVTRGEVQLGKPKISVVAALELAADHYVVELDASLPRTACTAAVRSVPADLLAEMSLAEWSGYLSARIKLQVDSRALEKTVLDFDIKDQCEFTSLPELADLRRFAQPFTHSVVEPDDSVFEMETGPGTDAWTPIEAISPFFIYAVLAHEDPQFFAHHGFSPRHIREALIRNLHEGRYVVGASTITMQLVKNVFLRREKTLARKAQEVVLTWWLERAMEKREILQLYLNVIEYGPGVYGVRNAAKHYFNRLPAELSPAESVFLATILPNPKRYHVFFEKGAVTPGWASNMRRLLARLKEKGFYDAAATEYGLKELEHFRFVPEGTAVEPRVIPGGTAALPYSAEVPAAPANGAVDGDSDPGFDTPPADGYD